MSVHIRPFTPDDYDAMCAVNNAVWTDHQRTPAEQKDFDQRRDPALWYGRWLAEVSGQVVGVGAAGQTEWYKNPSSFYVRINVHPDHQGHGVGSALYDLATTESRARGAVTWRADVREDVEQILRFYEKRGFKEELRIWESRLTVTDFDFTPYAEAESRVTDQSIRIATFAELESDPDRNRKVYDLEITVSPDMPHVEPIAIPTFERYVEVVLNRPDMIPEACFIAVDGDVYVGVSALSSAESDNDLHTGLTGVRREYRRRGIALALKLRAIAYAKSHGHPVIRTENESTNRPMLSINEMLGFEKQPAWIVIARREQPTEPKGD